MKEKKALEKLEQSLSNFMIEEMCKADPTKRSTPEMYRYKGLSLNINTDEKTKDKLISVRIGVLEAEFKIDSHEKNSGALAPQEEKLVTLWLSKSENSHAIKRFFYRNIQAEKIAIIPFDLEHYYVK